MPIIAYQSFNSNSSANHGLASASYQRFTRDANTHATSQGHQALVLPHDPMEISAPFEGPAELRPIELLATPQTVNVFGSQIALAWQNFYRIFGGMPDIMVCGEIDTSHPDFAAMIGGSNLDINPVPAKKACQSFTAISQSTVASQISFLKSGEGFVAYSIGDLVVVFVHVPNRICSSKSAIQDFYLKIAHSLHASHKIIDLVIGDTNQGSFDFTVEMLNTALHPNIYKNASAKAQVEKVDNYQVFEKGTNAKGTKMYDVAVYRSNAVELKHHAAYLSQSSSGVTITDHCGLAVEIERKASS